MSKENIKFNTNEDVLFEIAMMVYCECNDKICSINEHLGEIYGYSDLKDAEEYEMWYEKHLLELAVKQLQSELNIWKDNAEKYQNEANTFREGYLRELRKNKEKINYV